MADLLARHAEALFWMARQMERAENLARILDVNETFSRDGQGSQNWETIVKLYADEERFAETGRALNAETVLHFYVLDTENPGSIVATIRMARENARALRPLISTEMWTQLNMFYSELRGLTKNAIAEPNLNRLCAFIKEACQTHTGITEGTYYRDSGWYFYQLGKLIERADQMTRLVDVKYHLLLPSPDYVGSPLDVSQWNAVLRSAAAYHAFRRINPSGMSPTRVSSFLLFNGDFPRSVSAAVADATATLTKLRFRFGLAVGEEAVKRLQFLDQWLTRETIEDVVARGLHETNDWIQSELIAVTSALHDAFFSQPPDGAESATPTA
ncbi:MAG: hypothetical protein CMM50_15630 [Rhodospirillaceae bacterium]|nr:hypothetical protein [Rhodospirillaceae bacterium]